MNRVQRFVGFVYEEVGMHCHEGQPELIEIMVEPHGGIRGRCSQCKRFGADTNHWLFLTGDNAVIHNLIGASFLSLDTNDAFAYMPGNFANIERIALVDPQGRVRDYFDGLGNGAPEAVAREILQLKSQH